jgi:hypothetical protein
METRRTAATAAIASAVLGLVTVLAPPVFAHHSMAMFDRSKTVTIKGTIDQFQWTNPHVVIWVAGTITEGGKSQVWAVELSSPGNLTRSGWTKRSVKPGDKVAVDVAPLRDGQPGGGFRKLTFVDTGQVLTYTVGGKPDYMP